MQNTNKSNSFFAFLFLSTFSLTSCEKKTDVTPIQPQEVDKTVELNEIIAKAKQSFAVAPIKIYLPVENTNREVFRDQNGEGYVLKYDIEVNCPLTIDLTKYSEYNFHIEVLQKNGSYLVLNESALQEVEITKNPDINKDGKTQNNEKYYYLKGKTNLKSTQIEEKKVLFLYYTDSYRYLLNESDLETGKFVRSIGTMKNLYDNGKLKCNIIGIKSSTNEVLSPVKITDFIY